MDIDTLRAGSFAGTSTSSDDPGMARKRGRVKRRERRPPASRTDSAEAAVDADEGRAIGSALDRLV